MTAIQHQLAIDMRANAQRWQEDGSPFYAVLAARMADNVDEGGICWEVLRDHAADARNEVPGPRLLAGIHRLVLAGQLPRLAPYYPSVGGNGDAEAAWTHFPEIIAAHRNELHKAVEHMPQTNEVGRADALVGGMLIAAQETGLPLRLLEIGASAGLNLRFDHFRYEQDGVGFGEPASAVRFVNLWEGGRPPFEADCRVASRRGCDRFPIDPQTKEGRLTLLSYIFADELERFNRLQAALDIATRIPATVDRADVADWLEQNLLPLPQGETTVLYHSFLWQYLDPDEAARCSAMIEAAGAQATLEAPFVHISLEEHEGDYTHTELRYRRWPAGSDRLLAITGAHGGIVHWQAGTD
jgi:hypothetical protein